LKWVDDISKILLRKKMPSLTNDPELIIEKLYRKIDGGYVSHAERERLQINDTSFIYGEVLPQALAELLVIAKPQTSDVLYDLGSGVGQAVICSALLYDWKKCVGIEFLPGLYNVSQASLKNFLAMQDVQQYFSHKRFSIEFIHDDFLNVDFMDADIIYLNATTLNPVLWGQLTNKLQGLKQGARVIVCTKKLDEDYFEIMHEARYEMNWGDCTVFIYQKK
jgi:hypothetical protein